MKVCLNNFDVILKFRLTCSDCDLYINHNTHCHWRSITPKSSLTCGGVAIPSLSDIFKL